MTYKFKCFSCGSRQTIIESMKIIHKVNVLCKCCGTKMIQDYKVPWVKYKGKGWTKKTEKKK